ncbi:dynamin family protein [Indiicoccus explosivorum]|uniref:dynamin family protein n=1 Tax=Indiicoccus explosivorum TaxID=1917864 RepID=UPI000B443968|nr:dynamin family protein [Indiicoccus explosivorum]
MEAAEQQKTLTEIARLFAIFEKNGDAERMQKAQLLAEKVMKEQFIIGFAGHFSSGKSTMINALTGETILPSSPIPTSATIVTVRKAERDFALVRLKDRPAVKFSDHEQMASLKEFAKSGDVERIEIGHADSSLPPGITVMDTPGVDSVDDAHRRSTESALHLADLVFYVMDYNHVQSELNFTFTRQLQKYTQLHLIVNQIDKHRADELSFDAFRNSVKDAFRSWGVEPDGFYFTSLKDRELEENDFAAVRQLVDEAMHHKGDYAGQMAVAALEKLRAEHTAFLEEEKREQLELFRDVLSPDEWERRDEIRQKQERLRDSRELADFSEWQASFAKKRNELLNNATITPYEVREALESVLEARQPDFKVGVLFAGKKTEEERQRRQRVLSEKLQSEVKKQIEPHMRTLMKRQLKNVGLLTDDRALAIEEMDFEVPGDTMEEAIPDQAAVNGTAVLNTGRQITENIRRWFRKQTDRWASGQETAFSALPADSVETEVQQQLLEQKTLAIATLEETEARNTAVERSLRAPQPSELKEAEHRSAEWRREFTGMETGAVEFQPSMLEQKLQEAVPEEAGQQAEEKYDEKKIIRKAQETAESVSEIKGFAEAARYLERKAEGLRDKEFTVALFGAFSAGKSSFANALLGDKVLPVSPNPTTAAINRIRPVTDKDKHETASVHLKTEAMLTEDVRRSFSALGREVGTLDEAYELAGSDWFAEADQHSVHQSFISAFREGYSRFKGELGETVTVGRPEFVKFVSEEARSCFVESVDFYYDSPLTRSGVTLVDTPGADSINARHTGVAFNYIKNADAILFITYYNHAFARADREFLIQLGRVKDAFEMDKMFFLVNAIDLAEDEEEKEAVLTYVRNELQRFGIRFPRLSGVSSKGALEDRNASGFPEFETDFHQFLDGELKGLALRALQEATGNTISRLKNLIRQTERNALRKDERLAELREMEQAVRKQLSSSAAPAMTKEAERELSELLTYVKQRVFYRFGDFFKEAYNPSTFNGKPSNEALRIALEELIGMTAFDLRQEVRATALRMLRFAGQRFDDRFREEAEKLQAVNNDFSYTPYETSDADVPEPGWPFRNADYSGANRLFRGTKDFFERNGKEKVKTALLEKLEPDTGKFLVEEKRLLQNWIANWIDHEAEGLRHHLLRQSVEAIEAERSLLNEQEKLTEWKKILAQLDQERVMQS